MISGNDINFVGQVLEKYLNEYEKEPDKGYSISKVVIESERPYLSKSFDEALSKIEPISDVEYAEISVVVSTVVSSVTNVGHLFMKWFEAHKPPKTGFAKVKDGKIVDKLLALQWEFTELNDFPNKEYFQGNLEYSIDNFMVDMIMEQLRTYSELN